MWKFWVALILGTILVATGLTYVKLHRGAQTISYPPAAPKQLTPQVEFQPADANSDAVKMAISANVLTFHVKESIVGQEYQMPFRVKNVGQADLELSLLNQSCTCSDVYVDNQRVSLTDPRKKIAPGTTATVKLVYRPKKEQVAKEDGDKTRIRATFNHNDERFSDNLHFEVVTEVRSAK